MMLKKVKKLLINLNSLSLGGGNHLTTYSLTTIGKSELCFSFNSYFHYLNKFITCSSIFTTSEALVYIYSTRFCIHIILA